MACKVCGMPLAQGTMCLVCEIDLEDCLVHFTTNKAGKILAWWSGNELEMTPSATLPAKDFADLVRAQRRQ